MANRLTWCLKRTFLLTNRSNVYQQSVTALQLNDFAIQIRCVANPRANQINMDYDEPKDFEKFADEAKHSRPQAVATLMKILSVTRENARKAVDEYPNFKLLPKKTIYKNFQALREGGFYKSTIKDNKYLLTDDTDTLKKKISIIQKIDLDINDAAPLFHLPDSELANFERRSKMEASYLPACNRLVYLAEKLKCDVARICNVMSYNPLILKLPAPKLLTITEYILEAGMTPENILNDVQVFNYNIGTIKDKVERAKKAGVDPLKPWVLRCQEDIWKKVEEKQAERESILKPGQSVAEYLCEIFDCDMECIDYLVAKSPRLLSRNLEKLAIMAKFLHQEGYKIEDIQRTPSILHRSFSIIQKRYNTWKSLHSRRPPLFLLTLNQQKFETLMKAEGSANKKENLMLTELQNCG